MKYISLFSGIEAATVAWAPLGWEPVAYAEIEPFPKAVLKHHYPNVPDLGDVTKVDWNEYHHAADVVVGGSPCQAFSVAGLRKALADPRGQLMLEYLRACAEIDPEWIVWENVPGVLSAEHGRAFRSLLEAVAELWPDGGGAAWRVLDAQFYGVAQRRERVFLVVNTRDWRRAAPVLFERESLCWDHSSSREKRQSLTQKATDGIGNADSGDGGCLTPSESQSRRVYLQGGVFPTLSSGETSIQNQQSVMLDFHQQDGRFKVSDHPDMSNTLTSHMGTGGNNVPLIRQVGEIEREKRESMPHKMVCRADTQANAAQGFDLSPTLMAHAGQDAPFIYPAQAMADGF